jgi:hypothetical protein
MPKDAAKEQRCTQDAHFGAQTLGNIDIRNSESFQTALVSTPSRVRPTIPAVIFRI